jgi:hypothetical protein
VTPAARSVHGEGEWLELRAAPNATHVVHSIQSNVAKERQRQMDRFLAGRLASYKALQLSAIVS